MFVNSTLNSSLFFNSLRQKTQVFIVKHVSKCLKLHLTITRIKAHIRFLCSCKKFRIIPNKFKVKLPYTNRRSDAIAKSAAHKVMSLLISDLHYKTKTIIRELKYRHEIIASHLKPDIYFDFLNIIFLKCSKLQSILTLKHARKFGVLMNRAFPIHVNYKAVVNLSQAHFNPIQLDALSKVNKFAVPPVKKPFLEFIMATEACIGRNFSVIPDHNAFRAYIANAISNSKCVFRPNIPKHQLLFVRQISKDNNLCVTSADKGGAVVVMDKVDYEKMGTMHLADRTIYKEAKYTINAFNEAIKYSLKWAKDERKLSQRYVNRGTVFYPNFPTIRFLPKIHKPKQNGAYLARPIINTRNSPLQGISNILFTVLRPYAAAIPHCIRNGIQVLEQLNNVNLQGNQLFSLDIKAMYTSMRYTTVKAAIKQILTDDEENLFFNHDLLPEHVDYLIHVLYCNQYFRFNDKLFQQTEGLFMGLASSGPIADITVAFLEKRAFNIFIDIPLYLRYVDDTLIVTNPSQMMDLLNFLNQQDDSIKFELEQQNETGHLNFLDITIQIKNETLNTTVFRKPSASNRYIDFTSFSPKTYKINTIDFMFRRAINYCSNKTLLNQEISLCTSLLLSHGYPLKLLTERLTHIQYVCNKPKGQVLDPVPSFKYAGFPYYPPLTKFLRKTLLPLGIKPAFKSTNLIRISTANKDPDQIIYRIPCKGCDQEYIGQTRFHLSKRISQHKNAYDKKDPNGTHTFRHYMNTGHTPNFDAAKPIKRVTRQGDRNIAEAFFILNNCAYNKITVGQTLLKYLRAYTTSTPPSEEFPNCSTSGSPDIP